MSGFPTHHLAVNDERDASDGDGNGNGTRSLTDGPTYLVGCSSRAETCRHPNNGGDNDEEQRQDEVLISNGHNGGKCRASGDDESTENPTS